MDLKEAAAGAGWVTRHDNKLSDFVADVQQSKHSQVLSYSVSLFRLLSLKRNSYFYLAGIIG